MDPVQLLSRSLANTGAIVDTLGGDALDAPSPCAGWTARDVLNHVIVTCHFSVAVLNGTPPPYDRGAAPDLVGDDPAGAYTAAATAIVDAFLVPGALERVCDTPAGALPGAGWIGFPTFDTYVHGWDIARAAGVDATFPDDITRAVQEFCRARFSAPGRPPATVFADAREVPAGAAPIDELVAFLGRRPDWKAETA